MLRNPFSRSAAHSGRDVVATESCTSDTIGTDALAPRQHQLPLLSWMSSLVAPSKTMLRTLSTDLNKRVESLERVAEVQYLVRQAFERARRRPQKRRGGHVWLSIQPPVLLRSLALYSAASAAVDVFVFDPFLEYLQEQSGAGDKRLGYLPKQPFHLVVPQYSCVELSRSRFHARTAVSRRKLEVYC